MEPSRELQIADFGLRIEGQDRNTPISAASALFFTSQSRSAIALVIQNSIRNPQYTIRKLPS